MDEAIQRDYYAREIIPNVEVDQVKDEENKIIRDGGIKKYSTITGRDEYKVSDITSDVIVEGDLDDIDELGISELVDNMVKKERGQIPVTIFEGHVKIQPIIKSKDIQLKKDRNGNDGRVVQMNRGRRDIIPRENEDIQDKELIIEPIMSNNKEIFKHVDDDLGFGVSVTVNNEKPISNLTDEELGLDFSDYDNESVGFPQGPQLAPKTESRGDDNSWESEKKNEISSVNNISNVDEDIDDIDSVELDELMAKLLGSDEEEDNVEGEIEDHLTKSEPDMYIIDLDELEEELNQLTSKEKINSEIADEKEYENPIPNVINVYGADNKSINKPVSRETELDLSLLDEIPDNVFDYDNDNTKSKMKNDEGEPESEVAIPARGRSPSNEQPSQTNEVGKTKKGKKKSAAELVAELTRGATEDMPPDIDIDSYTNSVLGLIDRLNRIDKMEEEYKRKLVHQVENMGEENLDDIIGLIEQLEEEEDMDLTNMPNLGNW